MRAYHIRTERQDPYDPARTLILDSLYIPDRRILLGFKLLKDGEEGVIKNLELDLGRAQAITDGSQNGIAGEVVGEADLSMGDISRMINSFSFCKGSTFEMTGDYDGSTECLVAVLSGELRQRRFAERVLRKFRLL
jgi:hypothetical protein